MEEKKEYSVIGTVTIGTDEYRDLIEDKFESQKNAEFYRDKYWSEQSMTKKLKEENDALKAELDKYKKFIKKNSSTINEDSITLFMSMLGEE